MTAEDILAALLADGINLSPAPAPGTLYASPRAALTDAHRRLIRDNKPALLELLTQRTPPAPDPPQPDLVEKPARRVFRILVAMPEGDPGSPRWISMIAPTKDPRAAAAMASSCLGMGRVLEVEESPWGQ